MFVANGYGACVDGGMPMLHDMYMNWPFFQVGELVCAWRMVLVVIVGLVLVVVCVHAA